MLAREHRHFPLLIEWDDWDTPGIHLVTATQRSDQYKTLEPEGPHVGKRHADTKRFRAQLSHQRRRECGYVIPALLHIPRRRRRACNSNSGRRHHARPQRNKRTRRRPNCTVQPCSDVPIWHPLVRRGLEHRTLSSESPSAPHPRGHPAPAPQHTPQHEAQHSSARSPFPLPPRPTPRPASLR